MDTTAFLFADLPRSLLMASTSLGVSGKCSMASLPFAGRYRLIDFILSGIATAGIQKVGVISSFGDSELMEHLGSGKDFDLARRSGGIRFYPPLLNGDGEQTRMGLLKGIRAAIAEQPEPYVLLADADAVCNIDVSALMHAHRACGADLTLVTVPRYLSLHRTTSRSLILAKVDVSMNVTDLTPATPGMQGEYTALAHVYLFKRALLVRLIDEATAHGIAGLHQTLRAFCIGQNRVKAFSYTGFYAKLGSLAEYFATSMALAKDAALRSALFGDPAHPILTRVRNSPPTAYRHHAFVRSSLIADGCVIDGEVENSILFRGVKVEKGAVLRNCIILRGSVMEAGAHLNCVVADSHTSVRGHLSGAPVLPFYVASGTRF